MIKHLKYNPKLAALVGDRDDIVTVESPFGIIDEFDVPAMGYHLDTPDAVEWCLQLDDVYSIDSECRYESVRDALVELYHINAYALACWDNSVTSESMQREMEGSTVEHYLRALPAKTPLVPFGEFKAMVDTYVSHYDPNWDSGLTTVDLDDKINEIGLDEVDQYSCLSLVHHFSDLNWTQKAEYATMVAYLYRLDIHAIAIALTPRVASWLLARNR